MNRDYIKRWIERLRDIFARMQQDDPMMAAVPRGAFGAGVTYPSANDTSPEHWLNRADQAMYAAKRAGKN